MSIALIVIIILTALYIMGFINALYKNMRSGGQGKRVYLWLLGIPVILGIGYLVI
jgi:hypothetical protein